MERRLQSLNIEYNFKWNHPYLSPGLNLSRRSNSLNSASGLLCKATKWKGLLLFQSKVTLICSCYLFKIRELQKLQKNCLSGVDIFQWRLRSRLTGLNFIQTLKLENKVGLILEIKAGFLIYLSRKHQEDQGIFPSSSSSTRFFYQTFF